MGLIPGHAHSYLVLGRALTDKYGQKTSIWDRETWGEGAVIIDGWLGALDWNDFKTLPQVIYDHQQWKDLYPITMHISDSSQGVK